MVRWYHAILSAYGFWLPNDPRGSWSDFVHAWELFRFGGAATRVADKRSHAHDAHDVRVRRMVKEHLKHPPARFEAACRTSIATGFDDACDDFGFVIHACAIGHDHIHLILARDGHRDVEQVVAVLKARATRRMKQDRTHPMLAFATGDDISTAWGKSCWVVYINDERQLESAVRYVESHPEKEHMTPQHWTFVRPVWPRAYSRVRDDWKARASSRLNGDHPVS